MSDHWWLIRAARISFLPSQPVSAAPLAGPLKPWLVGGGGVQEHPHLRLQPADMETHRRFDPLGDLKIIAPSRRPSEQAGARRGHPGPG